MPEAATELLEWGETHVLGSSEGSGGVNKFGWGLRGKWIGWPTPVLNWW